MKKRYQFKEGKIHNPMSEDSIFARDDFLKKWDKNKLFETQSCYVCENIDFEPLGEIDRYGFLYPTGICNVCGNIQQEQYYTDEALTDFYTNYYRKVYGNPPPDALFENQKKLSGAIIYQFITQFNQPKKVLEVGCGAGGILGEFYDAGCEVLGLDFDDDYLQAALDKGVSVRKGSLEMLEDHEKFDLVILNHVLEHITTPISFLQKIKLHLKEEGLIYIGVPSIESVNNGEYSYDLLGYWQNAHTCHFTVKSLSLIAVRSGLEAVSITNDIFSCWRPASVVRDVNKSELQESLRYSKRLLGELEFKRQFISGAKKVVRAFRLERLLKPLYRRVIGIFKG